MEAGRPFFLYLPYTHDALSGSFRIRITPGKTGNGRFADVLAQVDAYNGMLLDAIEELGIRDNTLFIFTADNGPEMIPEGSSTPSVDYFIPGSPGPWRGSLFTGFEGSLRVPFAARWPGQDSGRFRQR